MDYQMLCPICATPVNKDEDCCSGCGSTSEPAFVYVLLVNAVEMLIKMGLRVTGTDIKYCTSHKTKITINLAGAIPEQLFDELPNGWLLQCLNEEAYYLRFNEVLPDGYIMISDLERWLEDKDADGFRSVLRLSGYDTGQ